MCTINFWSPPSLKSFHSSRDEELLCEGLTLNDDLHNVLSKYDAIVIETIKGPKKQKSLQALVDIDDENEPYPR